MGDTGFGFSVAYFFPAGKKLSKDNKSCVWYSRIIPWQCNVRVP